MYAKLFKSLYQGTLRGNSHGLLVFTNLLANADMTGVVDMHPRAIAEEVGLTQEQVRAALLELEAEDIESRSPEEGGRRLLRLDDHRAWGWRIVNYLKYRSIRNEEDRREQNRLAQERFRNKQASASSKQSKPRKPMSAHTEAEAEAEKTTSSAPDGFDDFWASWPKTDRKQDKKKCADAWRKKKLSSSKAEIIAHVEALKRTRKWRDGYEPAPLTYLNGERWRDGMPEAEIGDLLSVGEI